MLDEPERQNLGEFLAAARAYKTIFQPTQAMKDGIFNSRRFSALRTGEFVVFF